jgi:hypothetical protein
MSLYVVCVWKDGCCGTGRGMWEAETTRLECVLGILGLAGVILGAFKKGQN